MPETTTTTTAPATTTEAPVSPAAAPASPDGSEAAKQIATAQLSKRDKDTQAAYTKAQKELAELRKQVEAYKAQATPTAPTSDAPTSEAPTASQSQAASVWSALQQEFFDNGGKLSEATRAAYAKQLGAPVGIVAQFETFLHEQSKAGLAKIADTFKDLGTFDVNEVLVEMAKTLPQEKLDPIQDLVDQGDIEVLRPYVAAHIKNRLPAGIVGQVGGGEGGFKSIAERRKAMSDYRFGNDEAYTAEFYRKNAASADGVRLQ